MRTLSFFLLVVAVVAACSSESDPGEPCDVPGGTMDVCAPGTVCGKPSDKAVGIACIAICDGDRDCPKGYDCKGVEGTSIKGCRYKD